jgi:hypothetical protein
MRPDPGLGPAAPVGAGAGPPVVESRRWTCRIATVYFEPPRRALRADVLRLVQVPHRPRGRARSFFTIVLDLGREPEALLGDMRRETRYEIRRAGERDGLAYERLARPAAGELHGFCDFYDAFAGPRGLPPADRAHLGGLARAGALDLSVVRRDDEALVWHAYCRGAGRAALLASASLHRGVDSPEVRALIGRANRHHHWRDILEFRAAGLAVYDLGGWYEGQADAERLRINRFKEGFGGAIVETFLGEQATTLKGRLALLLRDRLGARRAGGASATARTGPSCTVAPCS